MNQTKNQLGQGRPDYLTVPTNPAQMLSKSFWQRLIHSVWPLQRLDAGPGIVITPGDRNTLFSLAPAVFDDIKNANLLATQAAAATASQFLTVTAVGDRLYEVQQSSAEYNFNYSTILDGTNYGGYQWQLPAADNKTYTFLAIQNCPYVGEYSSGRPNAVVLWCQTDDTYFTPGNPGTPTLNPLTFPRLDKLKEIWIANILNAATPVINQYAVGEVGAFNYFFYYQGLANYSNYLFPTVYRGQASVDTYYIPGEVVFYDAGGDRYQFICDPSVDGANNFFDPDTGALKLIDYATYPVDPGTPDPNDNYPWRLLSKFTL